MGIVSTGRKDGSRKDRLAEAARRDREVPDIDWSRLPVGSVVTRWSAPSGSLAVVSLGDPVHPRVVLVPGITGSKEDFNLMMPELVAAGFYVQSYDLAGQYESADAGPRAGDSYDYALFSTDLVAFLEQGEPAHLLGYSFAGIIAQLVLVSRPELVDSLVLLTTPPDTGQAFRSVRWIGPLSDLASARIAAGLMIWGIKTNKNRVRPGRLAFVRARFALTKRASVDDAIRLMRHVPDLRDEIAALNVPKLVAVGTHDLWPLRRHRRFAERIGARLVVYRTGHSPCETAPHQLSADLLALYAR